MKMHWQQDDGIRDAFPERVSRDPEPIYAFLDHES